MKKIVLILLICLSKPIFSFSQNLTKVRYEIILNVGMFDSIFKNVQLTPQLVISPDSLITLSDGSQSFLLGWGGITPFGGKSNSKVNSFSFTQDGLLMAVRKDELCYMNGEGELKKIIGLPTEDMTIMPGTEVMYLMDQKRNDEKYRLYAFAKGGKYKELLITPKPITAVIEKYDSLYLAIGSCIYSYSPSSDKLNLVVGLDKDLKICSITHDRDNDILYFSTKQEIFAYREGKIIMITDELGGIIQFFGGGLVIFSPETKDILRIVNISESFQFK